MEPSILRREDLGRLIEALAGKGYRVLGPVVRDGAVVYDSINSVTQFPSGWIDRQNGGSYKLEKSDDPKLFSYTVGPHSWKKYLHTPLQQLWSAVRGSDGFQVQSPQEEESKIAFFGVRSCELHAIAIQDRVLLQGPYRDSFYAARRKNLFIIAVNCTRAGGTCFCASMGTGPRATFGFDLVFTELLDSNGHRFLIEAGTTSGEEFLMELPHSRATTADQEAAKNLLDQATAQMGRSMQTQGIKELLYRNYDHRRWDQVAARCLSCANCTLVCPTCFCTTVEDVTDLTGDHAERQRRWDSCFTMDFSYIHGGPVRSSVKARYRQWLTHKLATWIDQFGASGCVGCGRCITWCPVGIDLTEEVKAIADSDAHLHQKPGEKEP